MTDRKAVKPMAVMGGIIVAGIAVDQATKALAISRLKPGEPISILSDVFQLQLLRNPGAAFSTGTSMTVVFSILALVVLIAVSVWVVPKVRSVIWAVPVGMGMAGVAGNFIDRLIRAPGPFRGYVIDFFALKHFAVFNVADILLTCAALLIAFDVFVLRVDSKGGRPSRADLSETR